MVLKIRIARLPGGASTTRELTLKTSTATIGRGHDCDVLLDDPGRVVSNRHALLEIRGAEVWITDVSRNGTFLNQSQDPLPPHQAVALRATDRIVIGPFELGISLTEDFAPAAIPAFPPEAPPEGLPGFSPSSQTPDILDLLGGFDGKGNREVRPTGTQPWLRDDPFADAAALDSKLAGVAKTAEPRPDQHATPVEHVCYRPPEPQAIPEGYDILHDIWTEPDQQPSAPAAQPTPREVAADVTFQPSPAPLPSEPQATPFTAAPLPTSPPEQPPPTRPLPGPPALAAPPPPATPVPAAPMPPPHHEGGSESAVVSAFLEGLGVSAGVTPEYPRKMMYLAGALLRELVAGVVRTLMARAQFKSELRLGVTTIRPVENNPFKFAADPDDVLDRLLFRPSPGFMPALVAAHEAFDDIQAHEMAMTAGLQAALRALLAHFDPAELEQRLNKRSSLGQWLPLGRKAHYWDLFTDAYAEVAADAADDFMRLFGESFAAAYREQIKRLEGARGGLPTSVPTSGQDNT